MTSWPLTPESKKSGEVGLLMLIAAGPFLCFVSLSLECNEDLCVYNDQYVGTAAGMAFLSCVVRT